MIKMMVIGHLGKDATTNNVNGKQVINFSVASTEKWRQGDEQKEKTTWIEVSYWSDSKISEYLKKGQQVYVEGTPDIRTYETKDGKTGVSQILKVFSVQLLGSKSDNGNTNGNSSTSEARESMGPKAEARIKNVDKSDSAYQGSMAYGKQATSQEASEEPLGPPSDLPF